MKPLLILPPETDRIAPIRALLTPELAPSHAAELIARVEDAPAGAGDALAVLAEGGNVQGAAFVARQGDLASLTHCVVDPQLRRRGIGRTLLETLLTWFDMTGGKHLYTGCPASLRPWLERAGFAPLVHDSPRSSDSATERIPLRRRATADQTSPVPDGFGTIDLRPLTLADLPDVTALLMHRPGPDPRVNERESASSATDIALEIMQKLRREEAFGLAAVQFHRIAAIGWIEVTSASDQARGFTIPGEGVHGALRRGLRELARTQGHPRLEFPFDAYVTKLPTTKKSGSKGKKRTRQPGAPEAQSAHAQTPSMQQAKSTSEVRGEVPAKIVPETSAPLVPEVTAIGPADAESNSERPPASDDASRDAISDPAASDSSSSDSAASD